jgi:hypothetical protein
MMDRRTFLSFVGTVGAGALFDRRVVNARRDAGGSLSARGAERFHARSTGVHPTPRNGITGAKVLTGAQLSAWPDLQQLFEGIRGIPAIADGIRCSCGCADLPGYYSLLSCYEGAAMATICPICQGTGRLTVRLHAEGQTLAQIRVAVDAQFG